MTPLITLPPWGRWPAPPNFTGCTHWGWRIFQPHDTGWYKRNHPWYSCCTQVWQWECAANYHYRRIDARFRRCRKFQGKPLEKQAALYCKRLGINYNKLSDVEFRQLVHILEKSKFFKSYVGQRKKCKWKLPLWEWTFLQRQFWISIYDFYRCLNYRPVWKSSTL